MNAKQRRVARRAEREWLATIPPLPVGRDRVIDLDTVRDHATAADRVAPYSTGGWTHSEARRGVPPLILEAMGRIFVALLHPPVLFSVNDVGHLVLTNPADEPLEFRVDVTEHDPPPLPPDTVATLLDLARAGQEADFRWLAASAGVPAEALGELWAGTVARTR